MRKISFKWVGSLLLALLVVGGTWIYLHKERSESENEKYEHKHEEEEEGERNIKTKIVRAKYFHKLLRDPVTDKIPSGIRSRELQQARSIPSRNSGGAMSKTVQGNPAIDLNWNIVGPKGLGGRTRALAVDQRDSDIILAGGVSGGMWKSTDGGDSWNLKSDPNQNLSVTWVTQDPSNPDTWYYTSGEYAGNSASDRGSVASYFGTGIYKSTNNGESWSVITSTKDTDNSFNSNYDFLNKVEVSPSTGSVFAATNPTGLMKLSDGGTTFSVNKGGTNLHQWTDFDIDENGNIIAVFSSESFSSGGSPGIFYSTDDGDSWSEITPTSFPADHGRSVITFAPSDPTIAYVLTQKTNSSINQGVSFFKLDISNPQNPVSEDRSSNLPDFGGDVGGVNLQGGYNMVVSVKPDDPDFVIVGATNLFRSKNGFATAPSGNSSSVKDKYWIGGYAKANNVSHYQEHHPDQHVIFYDPNNPDKVWSGHDGGISLTSDITTSPVNWTDRDEGYITGQFYTVDIPDEAGDNRYLGGTQDNGTPFFRDDTGGKPGMALIDVSSGDGGVAVWGDKYAYVSSQNGKVIRITKNSNGNLSSPYDGSSNTAYSSVYPSGATGKLFIHPYAVDPNDEDVMFYPGGGSIWINTKIGSIPDYNGDGTMQGWDEYTGTSSAGYNITAITATNTNPSGRLYYGASNTGQSGGKPELYYADQAAYNFNPQEISIPNTPDGAYVHDIAVNPADGDEVIVVMSNYNITGLYHTTDGGQNWNPIEGNLTGSQGDSGPSLRSSTILPTQQGPVYFVGTSTGVYSTGALDDGNTQWVRESDDGSQNSIGYSIVEDITSRRSDGIIAAATHGRGIYRGKADVDIQGDGQVPDAPTGAMASAAGNRSNVSLAWDTNSENDLIRYYIYRGTDSNSIALYDSVSSTGTSFTDKDVSAEVLYYKVAAKDVEGNTSNKSSLEIFNNFDKPVNDSWVLVGSPLTNTKTADASDKSIFEFSGSYKEPSDLAPQKGYWIKSRLGSSIALRGSASSSATISLDKGWNLIGGIGGSVATSAIDDANGILSSADIFKYKNGSYEAASEIAPNNGYWINADQSGDISLSLGGSNPKQQKQPYVKNESSTDKIVFKRANSSQAFYVSPKSIQGPSKEMYLMPPKAPQPRLDVRTDDGYRLADDANTKLKLTTLNFPVTARLSPQSVSKGYTLKGVAGRDTVYHKLMPGKEVSLQRQYEELILDASTAGSAITETDLKPNYPNPFNPSTKIRYQLASEADVQLQVYDILGRKVRTLVDGLKRPGQYNVRFDGSQLSSGTYFIHLKAGKTVKVQKMTLIK